MEGVEWKMAKTQLNDPNTQTKVQAEEADLKGTFIAVLFVGAFLVVTWFGVWGIFVNR